MKMIVQDILLSEKGQVKSACYLREKDTLLLTEFCKEESIPYGVYSDVDEDDAFLMYAILNEDVDPSDLFIGLNTILALTENRKFYFRVVPKKTATPSSDIVYEIEHEYNSFCETSHIESFML